jgi:hypothetical protein
MLRIAGFLLNRDATRRRLRTPPFVFASTHYAIAVPLPPNVAARATNG